MSDEVDLTVEHDSHARLFVVTGPDGDRRQSVATGLAQMLERSVLVDGGAIGDMVVRGRAPLTEAPTVPAVEQLFLRYAAALNIADTYRAAGFDAVLTDDVLGEFAADFLELAAPEDVHLVVLSAPAEDDAEPLGLWLADDAAPTDEVVREVIRRQHEALVTTSDD